MPRHFIAVPFALILALALAGCGKKPAPETPEAPPAAPEQPAELEKNEPEKKPVEDTPNYERLKKGSSAARVAAIRDVVWKQDRAAVPVLKEVRAGIKQDPHRDQVWPAVGTAACAALCLLDPEGYAEHLTALKQWRSVYLEGQGKGAQPPYPQADFLARAAIVKGLSSTDPAVYEPAYSILEVIRPDKNETVQVALRPILSDPKHPVHEKAWKALEGFPHWLADPLPTLWLGVLTESADLATRRRAAEWLSSELTKEQAADAMPFLTDADLEIRAHVALGLIQTGEIYKALPVALSYPWPQNPATAKKRWENRIKTTPQFVPQSVGRALWALTFEERQWVGEIAAQNVKTGDNKIKRIGLSILSELPISHIEAYRPGLTDPDPVTRAAALEFFLEVWDDPTYVGELLATANSLKDENELGRVLNRYNTFRHGLTDRSVFDQLVALTKNPTNRVRLWALQALPPSGPFVKESVPLLVDGLTKSWQLPRWDESGGDYSSPYELLGERLRQCGPAAGPAVPELAKLLETSTTHDHFNGVLRALQGGALTKESLPDILDLHQKQFRLPSTSRAKPFWRYLRPEQELGYATVFATFGADAKDALKVLYGDTKGAPKSLYSPIRARCWVIDPESDPDFPADYVKILRDPRYYAPPGQLIDDYPSLAKAMTPHLADLLTDKSRVLTPREIPILIGVVGPVPEVLNRIAASLPRPRYGVNHKTMQRPAEALRNDAFWQPYRVAVAALDRPDADSRIAACKLLGKIGIEAQAALVKLDTLRKKDPDANVRAEAQAAFHLIDDPYNESPTKRR